MTANRITALLAALALLGAGGVVAGGCGESDVERGAQDAEQGAKTAGREAEKGAEKAGREAEDEAGEAKRGVEKEIKD